MKRSLLRGDRSKLGEVAMQSAAGDLARILQSSDRVTALAGLAAAPHTDDAWLLLIPLADHAAGPDRPMAALAAHSAAAIADLFDPERALTRDAPADVLAHALDRWRAIAAARDRWSDVRVSALEVSAALAPVVHALTRDPVDAYDLSLMARDPDPEVRRGAFELIAHPIADHARATAAAAVRDDADPVVAVAAAQAVCAGLVSGQPAGPALDALGSDGLARLRALVADASLPPAAVFDGARCLAADASAESKRAIRALQSSGPRSIRRSIRSLIRGRPDRATSP